MYFETDLRTLTIPLYHIYRVHRSSSFRSYMDLTESGQLRDSRNKIVNNARYPDESLFSKIDNLKTSFKVMKCYQIKKNNKIFLDGLRRYFYLRNI